MKRIFILLTGLGLLIIAFAQLPRVADTKLIIFADKVVAQTSSTPPKSKDTKTNSVPLPEPTPVCSPQPTPLSETERNNPLRERKGEDILNSGLGTPDWDCDGICNIADNCIFVYNPDQKDSDGDGKGDACNPRFVGPSFRDSRCDEDGDGVPDFKDNCPLACNPNQKDVNGNGIGDVCDQAFPDPTLTKQVCKNPSKVIAPKPLPAQLNGNCENDPGCDPFGDIYKRYELQDSDSDGVPDYKDNCPLVCNPDQKDVNKNGIGDLCDTSLTNAVLTLQTCVKTKNFKTTKP